MRTGVPLVALLSLSLSLLTVPGCAGSRGIVILAFAHGGDAGAEGIRADAAATAALRERGFAVEHVDLDSGVQNPHLDEGTDDQRAVSRAAALTAEISGNRRVAGVIVGPTRAIADAVAWRKLGVPVVAVAPLVRDVACACDNEATLRKARDVAIEASDGTSWTDARGRRFARLADAVAHRPTFVVVSRRGFAFRVPVRAVRAVLTEPGTIDRRDFDAAAAGLAPLPMRAASVEKAARDAVAMLVP